MRWLKALVFLFWAVLALLHAIPLFAAPAPARDAAIDAARPAPPSAGPSRATAAAHATASRRPACQS